jgi:huntingtin interacting protein 1
MNNHFVMFPLQGASSVKEFYSKNHKWTEGLVSAAKLVGVGANFLM